MHPAEVIALALEARTLPAAIPERRCLEAPAALAPAAGAAMTGAVLALVAGFLVTRRFIRRALYARLRNHSRSAAFAAAHFVRDKRTQGGIGAETEQSRPGLL